MDDIVKQAMAKWPDVPHCYGWLALDARGVWRMRNERAQALGLRGDTITNPAMLSFITRNYACDESGRWYFQNGPQRVYVNLEATPYIASIDPAQGFVLNTGEPLVLIDSAWMTEEGCLILEANGKIAQVDDRDMADIVAHLRVDGDPADEDHLLEWLKDVDHHKLSLETPSRRIPLQRLVKTDIAKHFGFDPKPAA